MAPTVLQVDPRHPDPHVIAQAAAALAGGGLVALPTETVYGLGANALDPEAVARIYAAKGRPAWNPLIAHVASTAAARALAARWPDDAERLAAAFWPGPLTIVVPRGDIVPLMVTAGLDAVAVRVPAHPVALALLEAVQRPIAAPSANRFTQVSPTTAQHVVASLGDRVPLVLDAGPCEVGIESTVIDVSGDTPTLLRPGMISRTALEQVLGRPVQVAATIVRADDAATPAQRAPGSGDRHYAPNADVWLFDASQAHEIADALRDRQARAATGTATNTADGPVTALLTVSNVPTSSADTVVRMPATPAAYARALYAELHAADARGAGLVVIEQPPDDDAWRAVRDRLARAAR